MNFIDLGLPSGTLWADENEIGYYEFGKAVAEYGNRLPTREQFEELKNQCKWEWNDKEYRVTGPNGNSIVLPAKGFRNNDGDRLFVDTIGEYLSSTPAGSECAWGLDFDYRNVHVGYGNRRNGFPVRLIKKYER